MDKRILFSTYLLTARFKSGRDNQFLDQFNTATADLFPILVSYLDDLLVNPRESIGDASRTGKIQFTLTSPVQVDWKNRIIYGYFESGFKNQRINIKDNTSRLTAFKGDPKKHISVNDLFFFIRMPLRSKEAYCVLQRRSHYGLKTAFHTEFKKWVIGLGYTDTNIHLKPSLPGSVFYKMINEGQLRKVEFIVNKAPKSYDQMLKRDLEENTEKGKFTLAVSSPFSLSDDWRDFVKKLYVNFSPGLQNSRIDIDDSIEEYQEIAFELNLNGKQKKFYARQQQKTLPDVEVTGLEFVDDEPTIKSLIEKSQETISDVFGKQPVSLELEDRKVDIDQLRKPVDPDSDPVQSTKKIRKKSNNAKPDRHISDNKEASENVAKN